MVVVIYMIVYSEFHNIVTVLANLNSFTSRESHQIMFDIIQECYLFRVQQTSQWYKGIHGFDTLLQQPNLLCGWIAGSEAELMEDLSDDHVLDVCHELLQRFTGDKKIPKPTKITRFALFLC